MSPVVHPTVPSCAWLADFMLPHLQLFTICVVITLFAGFTYFIYQNYVKIEDPIENEPPPVQVYVNHKARSLYVNLGLE